MTISPEAKEAATAELLAFDYPSIYDTHERGHYVQLAINSATAPLQEEISVLKKIEAYANEKLANANHHSVFESIDDAALTIKEQRKEIERLRGEVEKAWMEATIMSDDSDTKETILENWNNSRAKRVAEGKE